MNKILKEVRLCQVDGFISALSLLRAKMMIRNGQRPYAHVDPKFYAPLPDDIGEVGGELRKMTKAKYDALLARIHGKLSLIIIQVQSAAAFLTQGFDIVRQYKAAIRANFNWLINILWRS